LIPDDTSEDADPKWIIKVVDDFGFFDIPCRDHVYVNKEGLLISEPYGVSYEDLKELMTYCDERKLTVMIEGNVRHHPACVRLVFQPEEGVF